MVTVLLVSLGLLFVNGGAGMPEYCLAHKYAAIAQLAYQLKSENLAY